MGSKRQAVEQATCEVCSDDEAEFRVTDNEMIQPLSAVKYNVACDCGESGIIVIDDAGTHAGHNINHESASWNVESDDSTEV